MANKLLDDITSLTENMWEVPSDKKYWLIRTHGGEFYEDFRRDGFVGLSYQKIGPKAVSSLAKKVKGDPKLVKKDLKLITEKLYPDDRHGLIAGQIVRFSLEMKADDVVMIPSTGSDIISIGRVLTEGVVPDVEKHNSLNFNYRFKKHVKWLVDIPRQSLDPSLYKALQAHQAINNLDPYADYIERNIGNFYIRNDEANLVLDVEQEDNINAKELFGLGYCLLDICQKYFDSRGLEFSTDDIEVKINLNSKGKVQFKSIHLKDMWTIAAICIFICGGGITFGGMSIKTDGVFKNISNFMDDQLRREEVRKLMQNADSLKIRSPDDAIKILNIMK